MTQFNIIEAFEEVHQYLGFREVKVFQFEADSNKTTEAILADLLKSEIFFKLDKCSEYREGKIIKSEIKTNHAFTDKIGLKDFEKLSFIEFKNKIETIKKEPDWGEDLAVFSNFIDNSINWIISNNLQREQIYFINAASISKEKLIEHNYYAYAISLVIVSITNAKGVLINHGEN